MVNYSEFSSFKFPRETFFVSNVIRPCIHFIGWSPLSVPLNVNIIDRCWVRRYSSPSCPDIEGKGRVLRQLALSDWEKARTPIGVRRLIEVMEKVPRRKHDIIWSLQVTMDSSTKWRANMNSFMHFLSKCPDDSGNVIMSFILVDSWLRTAIENENHTTDFHKGKGS